MSSVNLKNIVSSQVPDFVLEDHPVFIQFLEAYYEYVNNNVKRDITSLRDVDNTLDEFIAHLKGELDVFGDSDYPYIDKILFLRKIKEVLVAKGSEAAYKFLFKILYDKPVNITYPWDSVLKASDGKWKRDTSLFIRITEGNPLSFVGSRVSIVGSTRTMYVYIDNIRFVKDDVFEFFIEKSYYGDIEVGDQLDYNGLKGTILPTTVKYTIVNPGTGYKIGDVIDGTTFANNKTITQRLKVTKVNASGGIESLVTLDFGYDYTSEFFLYTSSEQAVRKSRFKLDRDAFSNGNFREEFNLPDDSEVLRYQDFGQITTPNYWVSYDLDITFNPATAVNLTDNTITSTAHGFTTGDLVTYTTGGGTAIGGLTNNSRYYVIKINNNTIKLATTTALAAAGTAIDLTSGATGTSHVIGTNPTSDITYSGTLLQQFYTESVNNITEAENYSLIRFDIGAIAKYQGYYYSNDGFLSDNIYIQDSRYYQKFSYLVTVDERLSDYKTLLMSFIHPAGSAIFGEYQIQNAFIADTAVSFEFNIYRSAATFATINTSITDAAFITETISRINRNPYDSESYFLEDYNSGTLASTQPQS